MKDFIDYVRSRPGQLTMASPGTGSAPYLAEMLFLQMADIKMTHVPYRGAAPAFFGPHTGSRRLLFRQRHIAFVLAVGAGSPAGEHWTDTKCGNPKCAHHW